MNYDDEPADDMPIFKDASVPSAKSYAVGYGKPPVEYQFKPGRFGNCRGRPGRSQSTAAVFETMFRSIVAMSIDGKRRRLSVRQVMALRAKRDILTGSPRVMRQWIAYAEKVEPVRSETGPQQTIDIDSLSDEQLRVLASIPLKPVE